MSRAREKLQFTLLDLCLLTSGQAIVLTAATGLLKIYLGRYFGRGPSSSFWAWIHGPRYGWVLQWTVPTLILASLSALWGGLLGIRRRWRTPSPILHHLLPCATMSLS